MIVVPLLDHKIYHCTESDTLVQLLPPSFILAGLHPKNLFYLDL
jgi:hypothetical protein